VVRWWGRCQWPADKARVGGGGEAGRWRMPRPVRRKKAGKMTEPRDPVTASCCTLLSAHKCSHNSVANHLIFLNRNRVS
jgi:hypothetical protein